MRESHTCQRGRFSYCGIRRGGKYLFLAVSILGMSVAGCVEFSHFGQVSDRESASAVAGVSVDQQQSDGSWKEVGETDGKGKFNIFRDKVKGGGNIRLSKPGYSTMLLSEADFLQQSNILMSPTGETDNFGVDSMSRPR